LKYPVYPSPALGTLVYSNFHCSLIPGGEGGREENNKNKKNNNNERRSRKFETITKV